MKALPFILFGFTALVQWAAPLSQIWTYEHTLNHGSLVSIKCGAPDPYDPLRGRFLAVRPDQTDISIPEGMKVERGMTVYGILTQDESGLAALTALTLEPPQDRLYIKLKASYVYNQKVSVQWPFDRFYINEKLAPEADKWFAENIRSDQGILAEVRLLDGRALLEDLRFEDRSFREILKDRVGKANPLTSP